MNRRWNDKHYRDATITREAVDSEARTVELAFSSEAPVERWGFKEILDHDPASVRLARLADGGAILVDHNRADHVGVVESVRIDDDRKGRAVVRFGKGQRADEVFTDVVDGIRRKVSVGYMIHDGEEDEDERTFRATDWEPFEISLVSIPADATVGIGRSADTRGKTMSTIEKQDTAPETPEKAERAAEPQKETRHAPQNDTAFVVADDDAMTAERTRVADILEAAKGRGQEALAQRFIKEGRSVADFRDLMAMVDRQAPPTPSAPVERIEMNFARSRKLRAFGTDRESLERAYRAGKWAQAVVYGDEKAQRWCRDYGVRVMTGTTSGTSAVVPNELVLPIIDLRERYGIARQYCYVHSMSTDTATVPRRKSGVTAYFVGREEATTASDMAFDDINLVAREVAALTRVSRSYAADAAIDIADQLADEMAYAFAVLEDGCLFNGDGTSTYGGIYGIRPKIIDGLHTAGAIDAATGIDTFAEVTVTDLANVQGALPDFPGIVPRWFASKRGNSLVFSRLGAAGGGNNKQDLGSAMPRQWDGDEIVTSEAMPTSTGDLSNVAMLVYGDLNLGVTFGDRMGFEVEILRERYAEYRQIGIQAVERFDIVVHGLGDTTDAGPIVALIGE